MKRIDLGGTWRMTGNGYACEGSIPGSVYSFLLNAGLMEDPFWRDNEEDALKLMEHSYTFSRTFNYEKTGNTVLLCCDGLDTLSTIIVNGTQIASTKNMHRRYEFDLSDVIRDGINDISLRFDSPTMYVRELHIEDPVIGTNQDAYKGFYHLRKAHCMFGWDWGPRLPDAGIWRDIYLLEVNSPRIIGCNVLQLHEKGRVFLTVQAEAAGACVLEATVLDPSGKEYILPCNTRWEVPDPMLWWPNGLGDQPLYTVSVRAMEGGLLADTVTKRVGLRTLRLIRERDRYGESFCHEVNGLRFFAMGADYIPEDNILSRITQERTRWLLTQAKNCNFNTIRVWGGGYYPDDYFFDICDELGIVVFLDMMLACCMLPDRSEIREEFVQEARENLLRVRHHACLGVICGNNEVESFYVNRERKPISEGIREGYLWLFEHALPEVLSEICPEIPYVPSSPSTCGHFIDPQNENYGDTHYWKVWHWDLPYEDYRGHYFRYLSEFGFQSFPCEKTVECFTLPEDRNIFSRIMEKHQRNGSANGKILSYLSKTFLYPSEFGTLLYASQLQQAVAIQYGVEHLRRNRGRCMGALYWQLNDCWPVASWASIDYFGRYKALQYAAKRFFAPIMISCEETGEKVTRPTVNHQADYYDFETTAALSVHNETKEPVSGTVIWALRSSDSTVLEQGSETVTVEPMSVVTLERMDFHKTDPGENHLSYRLERNGMIVSEGSVLFTAPKHYQFTDPHLSAVVEGDEITVFADAYARAVEIDSPGSDLILSDNYFDMERGSRTVKILEGSPKTICLRSVFDIR